MSFETVILKKVEDVLGTINTAEFFSGTLFIKCTESDARAVFSRLHKDLQGKVLVSKASSSPEYAFDFTV